MAVGSNRRVVGWARSGFSLLETLVAVTIFSIAIVSIIEGIASSSRRQSWIESENRAAMLAQNVMAELEHIGEYTVGVDGGQFEGQDARFSWMSEVLEAEYEGLYEIHVVISWSDGGAQRDFSLVTYVRERLMDEFEETTDAFAERQSQ